MPLESSVFSTVSLTIAIIALTVATWQARASARSAERTHALPIISEVFREFRSPQFRNSMSSLLIDVRKQTSTKGFRAQSKAWQDNAYRVCYFFDYIGALVHTGLIREELAISLWGSPTIMVWRAIEPLIYRERKYRKRSYPSGASPGFLVYYEDLICRIIDQGGEESARRIQEHSGLRHLRRPLSDGLTFTR